MNHSDRLSTVSLPLFNLGLRFDFKRAPKQSAHFSCAPTPPAENISMLPTPLTQESIYEAIDRVCSLASDSDRQDSWKIRRATTRDFSAGSIGEETLLFGIIASPTVGSSNGGADILTTFYLAYSTWDGRVLYLDRAGFSNLGSWSDMGGLPLLLRRSLADIAVRLYCARFTWQHDQSESFPQYPGSSQSETLHGWLTLHWGAEAIRDFLSGQHGLELKRCDGAIDNDMLRETIDNCLKGQLHSNLGLKLATVEDVNEIGRLVQGLADFENEPDAVHVTVDLYRRDGFEDRPRFYCILLHHTDDNKTVYTCGMAFCYIGCTLSGGHFLYLEDLFIEEAYRGNGAGTMVMKALASIGYTLGCCRLVWQALVSPGLVPMTIAFNDS
jgi:GNAT superfamily N-acetyltransferase